MFLHSLKYNFLNNIRQKDLVFWMMCFPIVLSTFFHLAFSNLYEKEEMFKEIPIVIVEIQSDETFRTVIDEFSTGESPLFNVQYTDEEKALDLLKNKKVQSIIYVDNKISLSVSGSGIKPSIIKSFVEQYEVQKTIISDTMVNNPQNVQFVIDTLSSEINCSENINLTGNNMDFYVQYFFNLIGMVALFGTMSGFHIAILNQGNLSAIGARKCISPTPKLRGIISSLISAYLVQVTCVFISTTYILFILKVDMGDDIAMVYLSGAIGALAGVALGFFIGSIGRMSEGVKNAITMSGTMFCCFLSGLMVGNMKAVVEAFCPIVNRINPAAVISDLFYCLAIYDDYKRYSQNVISLLIMTVIFTVAGFLLTRRTKYASI